MDSATTTTTTAGSGASRNKENDGEDAMYDPALMALDQEHAQKQQHQHHHHQSQATPLPSNNETKTTTTTTAADTTSNIDTPDLSNSAVLAPADMSSASAQQGQPHASTSTSTSTSSSPVKTSKPQRMSSAASSVAGPSVSGTSGTPGQVVFPAVYSSVPVYEMMVRGIGVMRRRSDSWINATQILKVAGIEKGKRTKILEKDIANSQPPNEIPYEKIQGGYGRYQGTWIPFQHAKNMAEQYNVLQLIQPLLDYRPDSANNASGPLAGLSAISPSTSLKNLPDAATPATAVAGLPPLPGQAQVANPQQQRLQQQQQLAQAQQIPLQTTSLSKPNGIAPTPAPTSGTAAAGNQTESPQKATRKRTRRQTVDTTVASTAATSVEDAEGGASKRPKTGNGTVTGTGPTGSSLTPNSGDQTITAGSDTTPTGATNATGTTLGTAKLPLTPIRIQRSKKHEDQTDINLEHRNALMSLFVADSPAASTSSNRPDATSDNNTNDLAHKDPFALVSLLPNDLDPETPIDDQLHTALHWGAALAKTRLVKALIAQLKCDPCQGNLNGETPLMRAILVTNNFDIESFYNPTPLLNSPVESDDTEEWLLDLLAPSIMTVDDADRSVLHHISLVAGIKGRSSSARHYLESILAYLEDRVASKDLTREEVLKFVNLKDGNGDTALNIAARIGNKFLVKAYLDAGADWKIANKLGLRPGDFGLLDSPASGNTASTPLIPLPTPGEAAVERATRSATVNGRAAQDSSDLDPPKSSEQQATDLRAAFETILSTLASEFKTELQSRSDSLVRTKNQLHLATKELADQRIQIASLKEKSKLLELTKFRIKNLERALSEEDKFDWTGRTGTDGQPAYPPSSPSESGSAPPDTQEAVRKAAFEYRGPNSTLGALASVNMPTNIEADPPLPASLQPSSDNKPPTSPSLLALSQVRRMNIWYTRVLQLLQGRIDLLQRNNMDNSGEILNELEIKKVIRLCTGLSTEDDIDEMLDSLITALESDGSQSSGLDLQRVSNFMAKVRSQELA